MHHQREHERRGQAADWTQHTDPRHACVASFLWEQLRWEKPGDGATSGGVGGHVEENGGRAAVLGPFEVVGVAGEDHEDGKEAHAEDHAGVAD